MAACGRATSHLPPLLPAAAALRPRTQPARCRSSAAAAMGDASWDPTTRATVQKIPLLTIKAGPRDKEEWQKRLKEVRLLWLLRLCLLLAALAELSAVQREWHMWHMTWHGRLQSTITECSAILDVQLRGAPITAAKLSTTLQRAVPQELQALIKYIEINKASDLDWFTIKPSNKEGTHWAGKVRAAASRAAVRVTEPQGQRHSSAQPRAPRRGSHLQLCFVRAWLQATWQHRMSSWAQLTYCTAHRPAAPPPADGCTARPCSACEFVPHLLPYSCHLCCHTPAAHAVLVRARAHPLRV